MNPDLQQQQQTPQRDTRVAASSTLPADTFQNWNPFSAPTGFESPHISMRPSSQPSSDNSMNAPQPTIFDKLKSVLPDEDHGKIRLAWRQNLDQFVGRSKLARAVKNYWLDCESKAISLDEASLTSRYKQDRKEFVDVFLDDFKKLYLVSVYPRYGGNEPLISHFASDRFYMVNGKVYQVPLYENPDSTPFPPTKGVPSTVVANVASPSSVGVSLSTPNGIMIPPTAPPTKAAVTESWADRWIPNFLRSKPNVNVGVDDDTRNLVEKFAASVETLPAKLKAEADQFITQVKSSMFSAAFPGGFKDFICMFSDVLVLALIDDPIVWALMQPRMILTYSMLTTAVIDGIAFFVQQFKKRMMRPVEQPEVPIESPEDEEASWMSVTGLFSALHYYTIGQLPEFTPKTILASLVAMNAAFTLARNLEHFGEFILRMIKGAIDAVWLFVTGKPWFDQQTRLAIERIATLTGRMNVIMSTVSPQRHHIEEASLLIVDNSTALGLALANQAPDELVKNYKILTEVFTVWLSNQAGSANYRDPRNQTDIVHVFGESGVGKSIVRRLFKAAYATALGISDDIATTTLTWNPNRNFQSKPPAKIRFIDSDDAFLITDPIAEAQILRLITELGSTHPIMLDQPFVKNIDWLAPELLYMTDNRINPDSLPVRDKLAGARRIDVGIWIQTVKNRQFLIPGTTHLDETKIPVVMNAETQALLDDVFDFRNHLGIHCNFTQFVSSAVAVHKRKLSSTNHLNAVESSVRAHFTVDPNQKTFPKPTGYNLSDRARAITDFTDIPDDLIVEQTFSNAIAGPEAKQFFYNPAWSPDNNELFYERIVNWMNVQPHQYLLAGSPPILSISGTPQDVKVMWANFHMPAMKSPENIKVPLAQLTIPQLEAMKGKKFHVYNECCRHENFCYVHGSDPCDAYSTKAVEVGYAGFSHWALTNPRLETSHRAYHRILADSFAPSEESYALVALKTFGTAIATAAVTYIFTILVNKLWATYRFSQQSDQSRGAQFSRKAGRIVAATSVAGMTPAPVQQADASTVPETNTQWLADKLSQNVVPVAFFQGTIKVECHLTGISMNAAFVVGHACKLLNKSPTILLGGLLGMSYPLVQRHNIKDFTEDPLCVQYIKWTGIDGAWVIVPKSLPAFVDSVKYMISAIEISHLTDLVIAYRNHELRMFEDKPVKEVQPPLIEYPLGDAQDIIHYDAPSGAYLGLFVLCPNITPKKSCSLPVYTRNSKVGRGHERLVGFHTGWDKVTRCSMVAFCTRESATRFLMSLPDGVLSGVIGQSHTTFLPPTKVIHENIVTYGQVPKEFTAYQNTHNSIIKSPLYDDLTGLVLRDPVTDRPVVIPPPGVAPSPIWDTKTPFTKVQAVNFVPEADVFHIFQQSIREQEDDIIRFADPKFFAPQNALFTLDQCMNGIPEWGVPAMDPKKSAGFSMTEHVHNGRYHYADWVDGKGALKPKYVPIFYKIQKMYLEGVEITPLVVANLKEELRALLQDGKAKASRVVTAYDFLTTLATRSFTMHLPGALMSGRHRNGCSFGSDMNANDGRVMYAAEQRLPKRVNVDAIKFDAHLNSTISGESEGVTSRLINRKFPFVSLGAGLAVARQQRIVFVVVGDTVYYSFNGGQSGFSLTTWTNCVITGAIVRTAWHLTKPLPGSRFQDHQFSKIFGDDVDVCTDNDDFTNNLLALVGERLGIKYTDMLKREGANLPRHTDPTVAAHLHRRLYADANGYVHAPLDLDVACHIHAFVRAKDADIRAAVHQNAEQSMRAFFDWGPDNFKIVQDALNLGLSSRGFRTSSLTYEQLYRVWYNNNIGSHALHITDDQEVVGPILEVPETTWNKDHSYTFGKALEITEQAETSTVSPILDTVSTMQVNDKVIAQVSAVSGVRSVAGLSSHVDAVGLARTMLTGAGKEGMVTPFQHTPDQGLQDLLRKEWPLGDQDWPAATSEGILTSWYWPDDLFNIPYIVGKLFGRTYGRFTVALTLRVNTNPTIGGRAGLLFNPYYSKQWTTDIHMLRNMKFMTLSAASGSAVTMELPWSSGQPWYDMLSFAPYAAIGESVIFVDSPLVFATATPPTAISIGMFISVTMVQTDGPTDQVIALTPLPKGCSTLAAMAHQRFREGKRCVKEWCDVRKTFVPLGKAIRRVYMVEEQSQTSSTEQEAAQKASSNSVVGGGAGQTISTIISSVESLASLAAMLDKPTEVAATQPIRPTLVPNMTRSSGLNEGHYLATKPNADISNRNPLLGEPLPQPTWGEILKIPGRVARFSFSNGANLPASNITSIPVFATMGFPLPTDPDFYVMTPLGHFAMMHQRYQGDPLIGLYASMPPLAKCSIRISWVAFIPPATAVSLNAVGFINSTVVDLTGEWKFLKRYPAFNPAIAINVIAPNAVVNQTNVMGYLVVDLVSPITGGAVTDATTIVIDMYLAGAPGFQLSGPTEYPPNWSVVDTTDSVEAARQVALRASRRTDSHSAMRIFEALKAKKIKTDVEQQASVRDDFGGKIEKFCDFKSNIAIGCLSTDVTSGPVELAKRMVSLVSFPTLPIQFENKINGVLPFWDIAICFLGYSGSIAWTVLPNVANPTYTLRAEKVRPNVTASEWDTLRSMVTQDFARYPAMEFSVPFENNVPMIETNYFHDADSQMSEIYLSDVYGATPTVRLFQAAGDDFSLYHFVCAPYWKYTAPPPSDKHDKFKWTQKQTIWGLTTVPSGPKDLKTYMGEKGLLNPAIGRELSHLKKEMVTQGAAFELIKKKLAKLSDFRMYALDVEKDPESDPLHRVSEQDRTSIQMAMTRFSPFLIENEYYLRDMDGRPILIDMVDGPEEYHYFRISDPNIAALVPQNGKANQRVTPL
jgi:hypothetical protein